MTVPTKAEELEAYQVALHRRLNDTNRAIDAVNARLDEELPMMMAALHAWRRQ